MTASVRIPYLPDPRAIVPQAAGTSNGRAVQFRRRPFVSMRVYSQSGNGAFVDLGNALADTGADYSLVQRSLQRQPILGPRLRRIAHRWQGSSFPLDLHEVTFELYHVGTAWIWPAIVGFTDAPIPYRCLLGHTGFFEFFDATFHGQAQVLELRPNPLFGAAGGTSL